MASLQRVFGSSVKTKVLDFFRNNDGYYTISQIAKAVKETDGKVSYAVVELMKMDILEHGDKATMRDDIRGMKNVDIEEKKTYQRKHVLNPRHPANLIMTATKIPTPVTNTSTKKRAPEPEEYYGPIRCTPIR